MRLHDLFYKFMSEYETELSTARKNEDYKRPFGKIVREDIVEKLREPIQTDIYIGNCETHS